MASSSRDRPEISGAAPRPGGAALAGSTDLAAWDAVETRDRIARGDVSAAEVVDAALARAAGAESLGAVVEATPDRARASVQSLAAGAPFAGVPTFIKDLAQVKGVGIRWGSAASGRFVSKRTDPIAARIEEAGFVVLGKSACPELGLTAATEPVGQPPCRNPWDPSRSTGGSSGGAAALVAAGVVPLAHGSDGGGSIRIPASCCGLVGFKPSRRRLDMAGSNLLPVNVATDGVLTRTVRDTAAFYEALEGRRPGKLAPIGPIAPAADRAPGKALRMAVFVDAPTGTPVDPEVQAAVRATARDCEAMGHRVEAIACPFEVRAIDDFLRYWGFVAWIQVATARSMMHRGFDRKKVEPWTAGLADYFRRETWAALGAILRLRRLNRVFSAVMARGYDVLVSPTLAEPAPLLGYLATDAPFATAFDRVRAYAPFTAIYNAAGVPAIALPLGCSAAGLPIGVQFAAGHGQDRTLLELAASLEARHPWPLVAPTRG